MELSQALRSTGAVRDFTDEPVSDDVLYQVLDTARFAPNGGNRQAWHVIVVRDPEIRRALRDLYLPGWYEYLPQMEAGLTPFAAVTDRDAEAAGPGPAPPVAARGAGAPRARPSSPSAARRRPGSPSSSTRCRSCSCSSPTCATSRRSTAISTGTRSSA